MKRFLKTITLFLIPVVLVISLFSAVYFASGEYIGTREVALRMAQGEPILLGLAYRDDTRSMKHLIASEVEADLLILGTSRSMQFRGQFFNTGSFFNAGGGVASLQEMLFFLQALPEEALPSTLVIVLDQYFYNPTWNIAVPQNFSDYGFTQTSYPHNIHRCMQDFILGKYSIFDIFNSSSSAYGMAASARGSGFYEDGSYSYGFAILEAYTAENALADSYRRILIGSDRFEYGDTLDAGVIQKTEELLAFCAENNIEVVAILPPYAPSVYTYMQSTGNYTYIDALYPTLIPLFRQYGFELYDYTYLAETTDDMYFDGFHGSDRAYAAITVRLSKESAILAPYLDETNLTSLFESEGHSLTVTFE
jgi:hypothetical protein